MAFTSRLGRCRSRQSDRRRSISFIENPSERARLTKRSSFTSRGSKER
jgi:hypothetical protein